MTKIRRANDPDLFHKICVLIL